MSDVTILTEAELRGLIGLDVDSVACVENAFKSLATEAVVMPPILRLDIAGANGEVDVKTAYVPGLDSFAIKISPGFFDNPKLGLASVNGLMVVLSAKTGLVEAMLLDNGFLTDVRTAAAGAVAAKYLSRTDSAVAGIIGAGVQARLQLKALTLVRPVQRARLWARDPEKAKRVADDLAGELQIDITAAPKVHDAMEGADIIVSTTPSTEPLVRADWLEPGQHLTAMGSDAEHKNEIEPAVVARADLYVADSLAQTRRLGELHHAIKMGLVDEGAEFNELGRIVAGLADGRTEVSQFTFADLTGTGVQDTAIATLARQRAQAASAGQIFHS